MDEALPEVDATQDENGFIHGPYGSFNPVTGEGLPIEAPAKYRQEVLRQLIQAGLDSGPAVEFDIDAWFEEKFSRRKT